MSWPQWQLDEIELGDRAATALEEQIPTGDEFVERYALDDLQSESGGWCRRRKESS